MSATVNDQWSNGDAYEAFMGRWSRAVAAKFVAWLDPAAGQAWLDVGCGTGALTSAVLDLANPSSIVGIDPSAAFIAAARSSIDDDRATFEIADAQAIPLEDQSIDRLVSGLCLNFVPEPATALAEMARVTRPGGAVAVYVWDYAGGMQMLRSFWDAANLIDPALTVDEGRNPICAPVPLQALFGDADLQHVEVEAIQIDTVFTDFSDYWKPFEGGPGPAPAYLKGLAPHQRSALEGELRRSLPAESDGSIHLTARAWAVRGER